ncbi:MAG TPA: hypothetical protein VG268_07290 [Streptosporangiaceae bacterium]|nr:hypothetical protein [Streptosporangiaceae bacterium]
MAVPSEAPGCRYGASKSHSREAQPAAVPAVSTQSCSRTTSQTSLASRDGATGDRSVSRAAVAAQRAH